MFQRLTDFGTGRLPANMALKQGRYRVIQTVGKGGMGAVYLAYDTQQSDKLVAIKEMSQANLKDEEELRQAQQRFQQEARLLQQLHHPHLPRVYDSFDDRNRSYLVMDYIQGKTLAQVLKQAHGSALSVKQVVDYGLQLCDVLTYLHTQVPPVVFRDLKPPNIMVRDDGQIFLIDFGIARFWQQAGDTEIFVSPGYSSPEQYAGQSTPLSDIFSLGATLHHCLTGHDPRSNTQAHQWSFRAVDFFNQHVPSALGELIEQMVKVQPSERPASIAEVQRRLNDVYVSLSSPVRLTSGGTYDPGAITYPIGSAPPASAPRPPRKIPLALPLLMFGIVLRVLAQSLFGGLALALRAVRSVGLGQAVRTLPAQWWQRVRRAANNWSWDPRVWTPRFVGIFLAVLTLILGVSLYLLKNAPDAPHLLALLLIFGLLCLLAVNLTDERLSDLVLRSIFGLMGLGLLLASFALQAFPDMIDLEQQFLPRVTLNQVWSLLLLFGAIVCLLRPVGHFAWADQLQLGFLAGSCALLHYGFAAAEAAQFPFLSPATTQVAFPLLIWGLAGLALLAMFRYTRPFDGWSRFMLFLVALAFAPLQYAFGYDELQRLLAGNAPTSDLLQRLAQANVFCVFVPLACALVACFTPQATSSSTPARRHPGLMTRLALFLLTLVVAALFNQLGQGIELPFVAATAFPLSATLLPFGTLYQLIEPLLVLLAFIAVLRLRRTQTFAWLDHALILLLALICALFDSAYWQTQAAPQVAVMDQNAAHQQFLSFAGQLPAYAIYGILLGLPLVLLALMLCRFQQHSHVSARLDAWTRRLHALLTLMERLLLLSLLAITLLLHVFFGPLKNVLQHWLETQQITGSAADILALLTIGALLLASIMGLVVFARLFAPSRPGMGNVERWTACPTALACLLLTWQDPQIASLPLLRADTQLIGNLWHWPSLLLSLTFVGGLALAIILARLWLRRGFFNRYRPLIQPALFLALCCVFLQFLWPLLLLPALAILAADILLASQIEKAT